jgi:hypothetical protein
MKTRQFHDLLRNITFVASFDFRQFMFTKTETIKIYAQHSQKNYLAALSIKPMDVL